MAECKSTDDPCLLSKAEAVDAITQLLDKLKTAGAIKNDFARDLSPKLLNVVEKHCPPATMEKVTT